MISAKAKTKMDTGKVVKAARAGSITSLGHAGAALRLQARHSIKKAKKASQAGSPPNTRKGRLRNAIMFAVSKSPPWGVIGPDVDVAGTSGQAHEFGGRYKKEHYDKRAFMGPALEKVRPRLPAFWAGSVKGD
jgi:hypothetical protein